MKNNKGYTLLEMIVVVAIIAIFSATLFGIISTTSSMMKRTSGNTTVQMTAQRVSEQIDNRLLKANKNIYAAYGNSQRIVSEIESGEKKEEKSFYITYTENNDDTQVWLDIITWNPDTKTITYEKKNQGGSVIAKEELATGVTWFHMDISQIEPKGMVSYDFTIEKNGVDFSLSQNIYIRNKVTVEYPL